MGGGLYVLFGTRHDGKLVQIKRGLLHTAIDALYDMTERQVKTARDWKRLDVLSACVGRKIVAYHPASDRLVWGGR
jgi:hypothetical protein